MEELTRVRKKLEVKLKKLNEWMNNPEVVIISDHFGAAKSAAEAALNKKTEDELEDWYSMRCALRLVNESIAIFTRRRKVQLIRWQIVEKQDEFRGRYLIVSGYVIDDEKSDYKLFSSGEIMLVKRKETGYVVHTTKHRYVCDYTDAREEQRSW